MSLDTHVLVIFKRLAVSDTLVLLPTETTGTKFLPICHYNNCNLTNKNTLLNIKF